MENLYNELVVLYLVVGKETRTIEAYETELCNLKDYINNLIEGGFNDFTLYENCCNFGAFGKIAKVENGEIIELSDELSDSEQLCDQQSERNSIYQATPYDDYSPEF